MNKLSVDQRTKVIIACLVEGNSLRATSRLTDVAFNTVLKPRLTNAFSKKVENHAAAIALHFMHYNFARIHQTLRITPAMAAGVSNHVWSLEEIVALLPI